MAKDLSPLPADTRLAKLVAPRVVLERVDSIIAALSVAERRGYLLFNAQSDSMQWDRSTNRYVNVEVDKIELDGAQAENTAQYVRYMWRNICKSQGRPVVVANIQNECVSLTMPKQARTREIWTWMSLGGVECRPNDWRNPAYSDAIQGKGGKCVFRPTPSTINFIIPRACIEVFWTNGFVAKAKEDWAPILKPFGDKRDLT